MTDSHHIPKRPANVGQLVQRYLRAEDHERLARLTARLGTNESDVLRRGLQALELQLTDPERHPALAIIGIAGSIEHGPADGIDVAREHDRVLADAEEGSWGGGAAGGP